MSRMMMVMMVMMMVVVWGGTLVTAGPMADALATLPEPKKNPNKRRPEGPIIPTPTRETSEESNEGGLVAATVNDNITVRIPAFAVPISTRVTTPEDKDNCIQPEIFPDPVNCAAFSVCNPDPMGGSIIQKFTCTDNTVFFGTLLKCDTGSCLPVHYGSSGTQSDPLQNPPMGTQSGPPAESTPDWYNLPPSWLREPPYWYNNPPSWFSQAKPAVKPPAVQEATVHNPPRETPSGHMVESTPDWYNIPPSWLREPPYWYNNPPSWFTQIRPAVKPPAVQEAAVHNPPRETPSGHTGGDGPDWYHIPPLWLREPPYWFNIPPDWYTQVRPLSQGQGGVLHNPPRGTPSGPPTDNTPDWYNRPPLWMREPPYWYKTPPAWFTLGRPLLPDQGRGVMHNPARGTPSGPPSANTPDWYNRPPRWMREPPYWYNTPPAWFSSIRPRSMHDAPPDTTHDSSSSSSDQDQYPYQHRPAFLEYLY